MWTLNSVFLFREDNVILKFENGTDLSTEFFETHGFNRPILVTNKEGLGMVIPDKKFTVMDVERHVGMLVVRKVEILSFLASIRFFMVQV